MRKILALFVLALAILVCSQLADAQSPSRIPRIGILWPASASSPRVQALLNGLRELGYVRGKNIIIEYRYADKRFDRLPGLADELVSLQVDVLVAPSTLAALPAKKATQTIPIVFCSGDPIGTGLVTNLSRPEGNLTGLTFFSPDLIGKRLEFLKEVVPSLKRVAVLWNPQGPAKVLEFKRLKIVAQTFGVEVQSLEVRGPNPDLAGAFKAAIKGRAEALLTLGNPLPMSHRKVIGKLAAKSRLPSIYDAKQFVEAGGLVSYGPNFADVYRRAATYVEKILKGAKPADLPVQQPRKFEMFINLKTAKALGLTIPPELLLQATKVIK